MVTGVTKGDRGAFAAQSLFDSSHAAGVCSDFSASALRLTCTTSTVSCLLAVVAYCPGRAWPLLLQRPAPLALVLAWWQAPVLLLWTPVLKPWTPALKPWAPM